MSPAMTRTALRQETVAHQGSGGISAENRPYGFRPAFLDAETGVVYASRYANGEPAPFHLLDGLPDRLVLARNSTGRVTRVKACLPSGFVRDGRFYTREQAARQVGHESSPPALAA